MEDLKLELLLACRDLVQVIVSQRNDNSVVPAVPSRVATLFDDISIEGLITNHSLEPWEHKPHKAVRRFKVVLRILESHGALNIDVQYKSLCMV